MIPFNLQLILLVLNISLLIFFILRIKAYKIELKYTILWMFILVVNTLLAIFPKLLSYFSELLYIETPVNTLFLFGFLACFMILYSLTSSMSSYSIKIKQLSQEIGLLKNELRLYKEENKETE
jgi:hypothetical protein